MSVPHMMERCEGEGGGVFSIHVYGFVFMHASVYLIPACSLVMCGGGVVIFHWWCGGHCSLGGG